MKGTHLGEFEELVLLTVGILYDDAYGLAITDEIEERTGRSVTVRTQSPDADGAKGLLALSYGRSHRREGRKK
jgi:PadR family transcriptional regulator, regulatory protein PadR